MRSSKKRSDRKHIIKTHKLSYILVLTVLVLIAAGLVFAFGKDWKERRRQTDYQKEIQSFYETPDKLPSIPGTIIRSEKMNIDVPNDGTAYRVLYVTQKPGGEHAAVSGMIIVPPGPAPAGGRKVIAWAHGTLGFGNACTPSRSLNEPLLDTENWLDGAMQRGYVVASTDYVGIGTEGTPYYLIGESEAHDLLNSVRAARNLEQAQAGTQFVTWGHSQGGHSALFAAVLAGSYAPELNLLGVAAAAPAAELVPLFAQQYDKTVAWAIGPDTAVSWPEVYPDLPVDEVLTKDARRSYERLANGCIRQQGLGLAIRAALKTPFFSENPLRQKPWVQAAVEQTPPVEDINVPIYIAQGLSDIVVLPNTTALLAQKACDADKPIQLDWLGNMNHQLTAVTAGPSAVAWMQDRFEGRPAPSSCSQPLPVKPKITPY